MQPDPKKSKRRLAIRSVIWGTFYCRAGDLGNAPRTAANAPESTQIQRRVESFSALRLGGTVKVLLCCDEANSTRGIHALLDTASKDDELD